MFLTKAEITVMFKRDCERASTASTSLDLKLPYFNKVPAKKYPPKYKVPKFQKFNGFKGNTNEYVARFLDSIAPFSKDTELYLREFSKSLTDRAYTWYLSLKVGSIQHWDHMVSIFNTKFFYLERKYNLAKLRRTR